MKVREIITESKVEAPKPRNFVAKNAKMGGAGQHKDKKKAEKQGDTKHKNKQFSEGLAEDPNSVPQEWREWNVMIMNNFYSGKYPDYSARYYSVVASSPEEAREVVLSNTEKVLKDLLARKTQDGKRVLPPKSALPIEDKRVGGADRIKPGSVTTMGFKEMLTPNGPMMLKFASGKIVDVQEKQGVAEGSEERSQNALWAQITAHEKAAKKSKDLKQQHHLKMADQLRSQLKTSDEQGVAEGVAETLPMQDAVKVLKQYGAEHFKTTSNELHFYKNGRGLSVDLVMNSDATRSVTLSSLNSATRALKGQGVTEGSVKELSMDLKTLSDAEFQAQYKMTKAQARAGLQGKSAVKETATAGSTSAGNVAVGAVYKNKKAKMQKPGTNALDMKGTNLLTGGSIKR